MTEPLDWQILDRFLAGEASPAEAEQVRVWMDASPEHRALIESLRRDAATSSGVDVERAWKRVAARTVTRQPTDWRRNVVWFAAATLVLAAGLTLTQWELRKNGAPVHIATTWRQITAPVGRRTTITLPDSTTVILNAGSTLRYASTFGRVDREVVLTGEGYFLVRHDAARPFRVLANNAEAQDIGTRFVIRAYDASQGTIVVVVDGAVGLAVAGSTSHDTVVVKGGMLARMTPSGAITTTPVETERYTGFTDGLLVLGDLTLDEAVPVIERWYDVSIRITDPALGRKQLNANFQDEPLTGVLEALSLALDVDIRRDGRTVTISPRRNVR
jgi:ferric-dicitrate binding protein FerR (iron transport regulator)